MKPVNDKIEIKQKIKKKRLPPKKKQIKQINKIKGKSSTSEKLTEKKLPNHEP